MTDDSRPRSSVARAFAVALVAGLVAGYIAARIPVLGLPFALAAPILLTVRAAREDQRSPQRFAEISGVLLGTGGVFLLGALNTVAACLPTSDFCGEANVAPLLALALVMLVLGFAGSAGAIWKGRQGR